MSPLRVVQVGLGDWGRDWAGRIIPALDEVEVVAYVDSDAAALEALRRATEVPEARCFHSFEEAVHKTQPHAALITTTLAGHAPLVRASLEAELHVLVEKPFVETMETAESLVSLATAKKLALMVSQNYRFFPAPRAAAAHVAAGTLGELYEISIDFRRNNASPPKERWRQHWDPQPLLVDMSVHHFDLMRLLLGRDPDRMSCVTARKGRGGFDGPPAAIAAIAFGEVMVSYRGSWVSAQPSTAWAGDWSMEFERGSIAWTSRGDEGVLSDRVVIRPRGGRPRTQRLPDMQRVDRAGTLSEFAAAIREGREPETSGRDNLGTLAMVEAAVESAARGGWVEVSSRPSRTAAGS